MPLVIVGELVTDDPLFAVLLLAHISSHLTGSYFSLPYRLAAGIIFGRLSGGKPIIEHHVRVVDDRMYRDIRLDRGRFLEVWRKAQTAGDGVARWVSEAAKRAHQDLFGTPVARPTSTTEEHLPSAQPAR